PVRSTTSTSEILVVMAGDLSARDSSAPRVTTAAAGSDRPLATRARGETDRRTIRNASEVTLLRSDRYEFVACPGCNLEFLVLVYYPPLANFAGILTNIGFQKSPEPTINLTKFSQMVSSTVHSPLVSVGQQTEDAFH